MRKDLRSLRLETLEHRSMLTLAADIVFLFDESGSSENTLVGDGFAEIKPWLLENIGSIDTVLRQQGIENLRYGLVGFGAREETLPLRASFRTLIC